MSHYLNQLFTLATQAHQNKEFKQAENIYRQILRDHPEQPDAMHLLGLIFSEQQKYDNAIRYISKAIEKSNPNPVYLNNIGEVYRRQGNIKEAVEHFQKALSIKPDFAEAQFNLANVLKIVGQYTDAINLYQQAIQNNPQHFRALYNLANTHHEIGNYKSAIDTYKKVISVNPNHAEAHNNLGIVLIEWDLYEEALFHYKKALELVPTFAEAQKNIGVLYESLGMIEDARQVIRNKELFKAGDIYEHLYCHSITDIIHKDNEAIDLYRSNLSSFLKTLSPEQIAQTSLTAFSEKEINIPSNLIYQGRDDKDIKIQFASLFAKISPPFQPGKNSKLHIGFVVTSGHEGVFIKCMRGILNNISTEKFNITIVCSIPNGEKIIRPVISNPNIRFLNIPNKLDKAAEIIFKAQFDILNYWEIGTDKTNYFLPFMKLARIQTASWGWPVTSGIPNVNYFISSASLETEESDNHYTEKLIRLNKIPVYYYVPPIPSEIKPLSSFGIDDTKNIYLCQQNLRKVHPDFDRIAKGILLKDPNGLVVFIEDKHIQITNQLKQRLQSNCKEVYDRIFFLKRLPEVDYLNVLALSHVAIDTLYYGGGANTCYDAFATGTPLITLPGKFHRSRFAYAAYQQMGFDRCIAKSEEEYINLATEIGKNKNLREEISLQIKERSINLFEDIEAVKELESLYEKLS